MTELIHGEKPNKKQICPVCKSTCNRKVTKILNQQLELIKEKELLWYSSHPWHGGIDRLFELSHFEWACDSCIEQGKALTSEIEKQKFCDYPPYLMYFDKIRECEKCNDSFTFSKEEQKYWYEELEFWVQSIPKNCKDCRKKIRKKKSVNTELSMLLENGNENISSKNLYRIAELYEEMGKEEKMKMYLTKAKKRMKKENGKK